MRTISVVVLVAWLTLSGCDKGQSVEIPAKQVADVAIELSTPDKGLKSYWAVRDAIRTNEHALAKRQLEHYPGVARQLPQVTTAALAKSFQQDFDPVDVFARDIWEIKIESESRAVAVAVVKNITPVPTGAAMSEHEKKQREEGERYRYILEKDQMGWRVSEIWEWNTFPSPGGWAKTHPRDPRPRVPYFTYEGV